MRIGKFVEKDSVQVGEPSDSAQAQRKHPNEAGVPFSNIESVYTEEPKEEAKPECFPLLLRDIAERIDRLRLTIDIDDGSSDRSTTLRTFCSVVLQLLSAVVAYMKIPPCFYDALSISPVFPDSKCAEDTLSTDI